MEDQVFEKRIMFRDQLLALFKQENWFTLADDAEFNDFLNLPYEENGLTRRNITTALLQEMALKVQKYSELDDEVSVPGIMFTLARICVSFFSYCEKY